MLATDKAGEIQYSPEFRQKIFLLWYKSGQPTADNFFNTLDKDDLFDKVTGNSATFYTLRNWIWNEFKALAAQWDTELAIQLKEDALKDRVEMLARHAKRARDMQEKALAFLDEKGFGNAANAARVWVEGVRIERESSGIPFREFEKLADKSTQELLEELIELAQTSEIVDITPNDAESD